MFHRTDGIDFIVAAFTEISGGEIVHTPDRPYMADLDQLPFPAYQLFPMQKYRYRDHCLQRPFAVAGDATDEELEALDVGERDDGAVVKELSESRRKRTTRSRGRRRASAMGSTRGIRLS
jgi:hypothetical protein